MKNSKSDPPGKIKIADAMRLLLEKKAYNEITTAEIAKNAGVTEALIYKYYKDKKDLLYQILSEYMRKYMEEAQEELSGIEGTMNKLRKTIWTHVNVYATNRVFAKILLLEVRSFPDYYRSRPYGLVKEYSDILLTIIQEGVKNGELRKDLSLSFLRQVVLGSIEHVCLTDVAFNRPIDPDETTKNLCTFIFNGIMKQTRK
ncbi:MAG TPA: TetR/AcrR family transcriptional regulator [Spirochaetes bacterium]|nr:TetR/AcrR family transcriptional regulator [Spirochaetota bacterium]